MQILSKNVPTSLIIGTIFFILLVAKDVLLTRFVPDPNSSIPVTEVFSEETIFEVGSQATRIEYQHEGDSYGAVLTWVKGTNLFFTNEHVTEGACGTDQICEFKAKDSFDISARSRKLRKYACVPGADLCALVPIDETGSVENYAPSEVQSGQEVFYVDINSKDFKVFRGKVIEVDSNHMIISGYARHGFSGSPLFNSNGEILGIIKSLESTAFVSYGIHALIFGWSQTNKFKAARLQNLSWVELK